MTVATPGATPHHFGDRPLDITSRAFKQDPYPFYAWMRAEQPVVRAKFGQMDTWVVARYEDVVTVLKDPRFGKNAINIQSPEQRKQEVWTPAFIQPLRRNLLHLDDPDHTRLRRLVQKAFTGQRIAQMQAQTQQIADRLLDSVINKVANKGAVDLRADFALQLPLIVITELLGVPPEGHGHFQRWSKAMFRPFFLINVLRMIPSLWRLLHYLRQLIAMRRLQPGDDLLSTLIQIEEAGDQLSEDELVAMAMLLLIGGHETTLNLITSGTLALLQNPDQWQRLRADPGSIGPAVEELLRFTCPAETSSQYYAAEQVTVAGVTIAKGEMVLAALASANRDEQVFANPDSLDLTRQNNRHLAFGHGSHYCLGAALARMEGAIAFNTLLRRLPNLQLAVPAAQLRWRATPTMRGLERLPVRF